MPWISTTGGPLPADAVDHAAPVQLDLPALELVDARRGRDVRGSGVVHGHWFGTHRRLSAQAYAYVQRDRARDSRWSPPGVVPRPSCASSSAG